MACSFCGLQSRKRQDTQRKEPRPWLKKRQNILGEGKNRAQLKRHEKDSIIKFDFFLSLEIHLPSEMLLLLYRLWTGLSNARKGMFFRGFSVKNFRVGIAGKIF